MSESNIDIARRCYPIGTKYHCVNYGMENYVDSEFHEDGHDTHIHCSTSNQGYVYVTGKWAKLILPAPNVDMRVQRGPESNPDNKNGKISDRSRDGTRVDVRWDDGSRGTFDYGNEGVIPVTPEFDTGKEVEKKEHIYKIGDKFKVTTAVGGHNQAVGTILTIKELSIKGTGASSVKENPYAYHSDWMEPYTEPKKLFTIQDLADGKCAVEGIVYGEPSNDYLRKVVAEAFPLADKIGGSNSQYYKRSISDKYWTCSPQYKLPVQEAKDFVLKAKKDVADAITELLWGKVDTIIGEIEVGDTVECIEWSIKGTAGSGWRSGLQFKVISSGVGGSQEDKCFFGGNGGHGVYGRALKLISKGVSSQPVSESKTNIKEEYHGKVQNIIKQEQRSSGQGRVVIQSRRKRATVVSGHLSYKKVFVSSKKKVSIG